MALKLGPVETAYVRCVKALTFIARGDKDRGADYGRIAQNELDYAREEAFDGFMHPPGSDPGASDEAEESEPPRRT